MGYNAKYVDRRGKLSEEPEILLERQENWKWIQKLGRVGQKNISVQLPVMVIFLFLLF